jgi:hypothetical protein
MFQVDNMKKYITLLTFLLFYFVLNVAILWCATLQDAFHSQYHYLLSQVAKDSPLFLTPDAVEKALQSNADNNRAVRLTKRIAAARMLLSDGQIKESDEVSYSVLRLSVSRLIEAGEKYVIMAQAKEEPQNGGNPESDNRYDILDDDEFNLYDILVFPFRLIGFILELLFNIILFPFKVLTSIIF